MLNNTLVCITNIFHMENKIIQLVEKMFASTDERNWPAVESTMANTVLLDFSSMTGNAATLLTPKEITTAWSSFLPGSDRTHHHLSNFKVTIDGKTATAKYKGHAEHFLDNEVWIVDGTYDTILELMNETWLITAHKLHFTGQSGNTRLPDFAIQRIKNKD